VRIALCRHLRSRRLPAILCTEPCQEFDFPTIRASAPGPVYTPVCEQRLRQLWSSKTQASKKVVECSICVTECPVLARGSEVRRAKAARPRRRAARDELAPPQWIELHLLPQPGTPGIISHGPAPRPALGYMVNLVLDY